MSGSLPGRMKKTDIVSREMDAVIYFFFPSQQYMQKREYKLIRFTFVCLYHLFCLSGSVLQINSLFLKKVASQQN